MKLKHKIITKMIQKKLTRAEVDFILQNAKYQDDKGEVVGVYYKEIKEALGISSQTFYDLKESLVKKDFLGVWPMDIVTIGFNHGRGLL